VAARGFDPVRQIRGRRYLNHFTQTTGGHGGPPLQLRPSRSFVTAFAGGEVVAAEGALAVVARRATEGPRRCMVIQRQRRRDLAPDLMTRATTQLLRRIVICMTKPNSKSPCLL